MDIGNTQLPTLSDVYVADRADQSQMHTASATYVATMLVYAVGLLTLLDQETSEQLGAWITGSFVLISLVLLGFFGQRLSIQALRAAGLVLIESRIPAADPSSGQRLVERWNSYGEHQGGRFHRWALYSSYGLAAIAMIGGTFLPILRVVQMNECAAAIVYSVVSVIVLLMYAFGWSEVRSEANRLHRQASQQSTTA